MANPNVDNMVQVVRIIRHDLDRILALLASKVEERPVNVEAMNLVILDIQDRVKALRGCEDYITNYGGFA